MGASEQVPDGGAGGDSGAGSDSGVGAEWSDEWSGQASGHTPDAHRDDSHVKPVNAYSNAVDPRKLYPAHFDYLMRDLFQAGEIPERWRVIDACETRLDEHGMEVEFTLVRHGTDLVWHRRVMVAGGKLVGIHTDR